ncbi:MAG: PAS domain-containing sensor histidine kinase [Balneolaceae bacterium]
MSIKPKPPVETGSYDLELFFELSADLFCIAGFDGYFKKINPSVSRLLGYSNEELFSRPINEFIHPDDREITSSYRDKIINGVPLLNFENRYVTKKGETVWLSWTSMPSDNQKLVYAIAKNITHQKKLEESRNEYLGKLTKVNSELKQFSYTASHDLRSPAGSLITAIHLLDTTGIEDEETLQIIKMIKMGAENLKEKLNNHVDELKQKEVLNIEIEEVNLEECLTKVTRSIELLIRDSKTAIETDFTELETIRFSKNYLSSIFLNLVTNSIKYARPEASPYISIHSKKADGIPQLIFSDNGQGFDMAKVKNKIFAFNQTFHNHSDSKGIGLYLVYNHVTSLGGQIAVESKPGEGTTFTISFKD